MRLALGRRASSEFAASQKLVYSVRPRLLGMAIVTFWPGCRLSQRSARMADAEAGEDRESRVVVVARHKLFLVKRINFNEIIP